MKNILKEVFGFNAFRPNQENIIRQILEKRDVFVVMPTGGGKSLCYQLPAKIMKGTAVVVSPLISLMKDQVDAALENNIAAAFLNSSLSPREMAQVYQALRSGQLNLLYIAPERFSSPGFLETLQSIPLSLFAIDEAHCISEWGHDFRPDYLNLAQLTRQFPDVPVAAFTATATVKVQEDIIKRIGLRDPMVVRASFNRPNLYYHITRKENVSDQVLDYIRSHPGRPGIIYRTTRKSVMELALYLVRHGIKALPYHAGLTPEERERNQDAFNRDEVDIIVATIAFGMGIDKSNARFVIHADLPKNVESYYQETGRAGRDGEYAECLLLFSHGDIPKIRFFIGQITDPGEQKIAETKLSHVVKYASHNVCRRKSLLAYFGEAYEQENCGNCDICNGEHAEIEITRDAQIVMSAVMRTGERFGIRHIIDVVTGANTIRIREYNHDEIRTYGAGRDKSRRHWSFIMDELLSQEALVQTGDQYPVIRLTAAGRNILFGKERIFALMQPEQTGKQACDAVKQKLPCDEILYEKLRVLRRSIARDHKVPPYIIFSDKTLKEMASYLPVDLQAMGCISGVGETKLKNYGEKILQCIRAHKAAASGETDAQAAAQPVLARDNPEPVYRETGKAAQKKKPQQGDTLLATLSLLKEGLSVDLVAERRNLAVSTITGHLEEWLKAGTDGLSVENYINPESCRIIENAFLELKTWKLTPVIELLENRFTYEEARIVRGYMQGTGVEF